MIIHRLSERPDLLNRMHEVDPRWPEFMGTDPVVNAFFGQVAGTFPHLCAVATDASDAVVATGRAVAFARNLPGRGSLPDGGLDRVMVWAFSDRLAGRAPDTASAVEIAIGQEHRGGGLSHRMLAALRDAARDAGLTHLVAPVRPNGKHRYPDLPMARYITMVREDGLPADPWLRVHVRAGGEDQAGSASINGHGWLALAVAGMDRAALRPHRGRDRARSASPRALRRGTRPCCLRRAQRLGRACAQRRPIGLSRI